MSYDKRFAIVITASGPEGGPVDAAWLETEFHVDESDWIVLSRDGWRAVAEGDASIWPALERKLFIGFYVNQPSLIAVIGRRPGDGTDRADRLATEEAKQELCRIVRRIRSLLLPSAVIGFWSDEDGALLDILEPEGREAALHAEAVEELEPAA